MKKVFLSCLLVSIVCNLMAHTESDYMFIKDGLKWVENYEVKKGCSYTGFVNAANQPTCYGTYVDESKKKMIGQFKDGKAEGVAFFDAWRPYMYFGEIKNDNANGIGQQTLYQQGTTNYIASLFKDNTSADGLAMTSSGGAIIKNGEPVERATDFYSKSIYDNNLAKVKTICEENNIRYVENMQVDKFKFSGGWKDGQPYYYGTYRFDYSDYYVYAIGYINYDKASKSIETDNNKPYERYKETTRNGTEYGKFDITNIGDTIRIFHSPSAYEYAIIGKDGKYKRYDVFHWWQKDEYTKFYKYVDGRPWGIYGSNYYMKEGFIDEEDESNAVSKMITNLGELHIYNNGSHSITYPNNDILEVYQMNTQYGLILGKYTSHTNDYTIGWFEQDRYGHDNADYYKLVKILYGKAFFADGELKQEISNETNSWLREIPDYKDKVQQIISAPVEGNGSFTFTNGDVYSGEWKNHWMHGYGEMTRHDGSVLKGTFDNGDFVRGIEVKNGTITGGYWKDGSCYSTDSIIYPNGTYDKYEKIDGIEVHFIRKYCGIKRYLDNNVTLYYPVGNIAEADFILEGILGKNATMTFNNTKWKHQKGEYLKGVFNDEYNYSYGEHSFRLEKLTEMRKTFANGIYEGELSQDGKPCAGKFIFENGITFEGFFISGEKSVKQTNGEGVLTLADGTKVQATFGENYSYNNAKVTYSNKDVYNGALLDGVREGQGEYIFANGDKMTTTWTKNNTGKDEVTYIWNDGRKFVGAVKGNKPGKGIFYNADGSEAGKKTVKEWLCQLPVMIQCAAITQ